MSRMAKEYLRWTGDRAGSISVSAAEKLSTIFSSTPEHWRELDTNKHGLADYGGVTESSRSRFKLCARSRWLETPPMYII
jgi:hypothetical protein